MNQVKRALVMAGAALFGAVCFASFPTVTHAELTVSPPTVRATEPLGQTSEVSQDISNGEVGTVRWSIEDGTLKLSGGEIPDQPGESIYYPWSNDKLREGITKVEIEGPIKLIGNAGIGFLSNLRDATSIENLSYLDTSETTDMDDMFDRDESLTSIDLSHFETNKVTSMDSMFNGDFALKAIDVSKFETSQVTRMTEMFAQDKALTSLNVSNFDTSQVTDMADMFSEEAEVTSICLGKFDTHSVNNMLGMFESDPKLKAIDVSHFDTAQVTDMGGMFDEDESLSYLDLSSFDTDQVEKFGLDDMLTGVANLSRLVLARKSNYGIALVWNTLKEITTGKPSTSQAMGQLNIHLVVFIILKS